MGFCRENWGYVVLFHDISWYHSHSDWENDEKTAGWDPHGTPNLGTSLSMESLEYHLAALEWRDRPVTCQFAVIVGPKSRRDPPIIMEKN